MQFHLFFICCQTAGLVFELRQKWQSLFIKRIRCPSKPWSQQDEAVIRTLVSVCYVSSSSSFSSPSSSFFKVSLASQEEVMYQLWIWIMTRTHTIPQPLYPTSIFANIKSNVENCKTNFKLISLRCSQQRSKRQACSSLQGLASGPGPCHQRRDLMILWRTPRTALNYPQTQWMTSTKQSKT